MNWQKLKKPALLRKRFSNCGLFAKRLLKYQVGVECENTNIYSRVLCAFLCIAMLITINFLYLFSVTFSILEVDLKWKCDIISKSVICFGSNITFCKFGIFSSLCAEQQPCVLPFYLLIPSQFDDLLQAIRLLTQQSSYQPQAVHQSQTSSGNPPRPSRK